MLNITNGYSPSVVLNSGRESPSFLLRVMREAAPCHAWRVERQGEMPEEPTSSTPCNALVDVLAILAPRSGCRSITSFLEHATRDGAVSGLTEAEAEELTAIRRKLGFPESPEP